MTPEEIAQMRADMAAGTPGPWQAGTLCSSAVFNWWLPSDHPQACICECTDDTNARRIARVPTLEAEVIRLTEERAAMAEELARVRGVLLQVVECDTPRIVRDVFRSDGQPSKHDICVHGLYMYEDCAGCVGDYARAALSHTGMTGPSK